MVLNLQARLTVQAPCLLPGSAVHVPEGSREQRTESLNQESHPPAFNATLNQHLSLFAPSALVAEINWTLVLSTRTTPTFGFSGSLALRRRAH